MLMMKYPVANPCKFIKAQVVIKCGLKVGLFTKSPCQPDFTFSFCASLILNFFAILAKNLANSVSPLPHCAASQLIRLLRQNKKYKNLYKALARQSSTLAHLHCYVACVSLSVGSKVFEDFWAQ